MPLPPPLLNKRDQIRKLADVHGARNVRIFGSFSRGEANEASDVDFLVELGPKTSSWFPAGLILDLEGLLGRKVDVVTEASLHPGWRERVLREAVPL